MIFWSALLGMFFGAVCVVWVLWAAGEWLDWKRECRKTDAVLRDARIRLLEKQLGMDGEGWRDAAKDSATETTGRGQAAGQD